MYILSSIKSPDSLSGSPITCLIEIDSPTMLSSVSTNNSYLHTKIIMKAYYDTCVYGLYGNVCLKYH